MGGWRSGQLRCGAFFAIAIVATGAPAAAQDPGGGAPRCAETLPAACLQTFGAGSVAAAENTDCAARLADYRKCISEMIATQQATGGFAPPPLSRAEFGFLSALEAELADNVGRLSDFTSALDVTGATALNESDWPSLRLRFFNATDNPAYFAAPPEWLARTQGFYDDLEAFLAREDVRFAYRQMASYVLADRRWIKQQLTSKLEIGRSQLLPEISAELAAAQR